MRLVDVAFTRARLYPVPMASLLFIAPNDLGESVLAAGVLEAAIARLEQAKVTIVCRQETRPLFRAVAGLDAIRTWPGRSRLIAWYDLARRVGHTRYDLAIDLSGSRALPVVNAAATLASGRSRELRHLVADWSALMGAAEMLAPRLALDDAARQAAAKAVPESGPILALAPGDRALGTWPAEHFAAVARRLAGPGGPLAGARIVLLGDKADAETARAVAASLDADGLSAQNLAGEFDLLAAAALLERATLAIAGDGAYLHIAAAMGAPALGLFGASDERRRGPFGARTRALRGRGYEEMMQASSAGEDSRHFLDGLSVDSVEAVALDLLSAGGLR